MSRLGHQVFVSSLFMLSIRVVQRGLGLISTLVLARLLVPADFGIVAIVAIVIQFFDLFSNVGSEKYLIQKSTLDQKDIDTAFSINFVFKIVLWLILLGIAPLAAGLFDRPDLVLPLRVAATVLLIGSIASPGIALLKRDLNYKKILKLSIAQKCCSFTVVMAIAFTTRTYWALIIGDLVAVLVFSVGSWLIHPYRPRFGFRTFLKQAAFSQWIIYRSVFGFVRAQVDTYLVSRHFPIDAIGIFHVSKSLSAMPASDIVAPAIDPLLSAFSRVRDDLSDLGFKIRTAILAVIAMVLPVCVFMTAHPDAIIGSFLGDQWTDAHDVLAAMAPLLFTLSISRIFESVCISIGALRQLLVYNVISTVFLLAILVAIISSDLALFTLQRSLLGVFVSLLFLFYLSRRIPINLLRLLALSLPAVMGSGLAYTASRALTPPTNFAEPARLLYATAIFFAVYTCFWMAVRFSRFGERREYDSIESAMLSATKPLQAKYSTYRAARTAQRGTRG